MAVFTQIIDIKPIPNDSVLPKLQEPIIDFTFVNPTTTMKMTVNVNPDNPTQIIITVDYEPVDIGNSGTYTVEVRTDTTPELIYNETANWSISTSIEPTMKGSMIFTDGTVHVVNISDRDFADQLANNKGSSATIIVDGVSFVKNTLLGIRFANDNTLTSINSYFLFYCTSFNQALTIPNTVTNIEHAFMNNCTSFNQAVKLPYGLTTISYSFMNNCTSFNQALTIPNTVTNMGYSFLRDCTSYNSTITLSRGLTKLESYFLENCTSFNQVLYLPINIKDLDANFMTNCTSFNQSITSFFDYLETINYSFMNGCSSFNQPIILNLLMNFKLTTISTNFMMNCTSYNNTITCIGYGGQKPAGWNDTNPFQGCINPNSTDKWKSSNVIWVS